MNINFKKDYLSLFPESPEDIGLNEITMRFDKSEEKKYQSDRMDNFLSKKRLAIVMGVIIFILFGLVDWILIPETKGIVWFLRFALIVPMFLAVFSISYVEKIKVHMQKLICGLVILMGLIHVISMAFLPGEIISKFHMSFIILILYSFIMMSPDFLYGSASTLTISLFYGLFVIYNENVLDSDKMLGLIVVILTASFGVIFIYYSEYVSRRIYKHLTKLTPMEKKVIAEKNKEIILLEKELAKKEDKLKKLQSSKSKEKKESILDSVSKKNKNDVKNKNKENLKLIETLKTEIEKLKDDIISKTNENKASELNTETFAGSDFEIEKRDKEISNLKNANSVLLKKLEDTDFGIRELEDKLLSKTAEVEQVKRNAMLLISEKTGKLNEDENIDLLSGGNKEIIAELETKNANLLKDAEGLMKENIFLKESKKLAIDEKSADDIKLMGRLGTFVSGTLVKKFGENIKFLDENINKLKDSVSREYLDKSKHKMEEALYMAGSVSYKFDLFRRSLEILNKVNEPILICKSLQNSIGQLASFFAGSNHMVDVSCKDNVLVRMNEESFRLIIQNLVLNSLLFAAKIETDALIEIKIREEKSKVILEYEDNGKEYPSYYVEILKLKKIDSSILSVNGIEIYLANEIIKRESGGNLSFAKKSGSNKIVMTFIK